MYDAAATIQCSNPYCQALNPLNNKLCHQCQTPIVKRYLWAIGEKIEAYRVGELIGDRYLLQQSRILLDTQPGLLPQIPQQIPQRIVTYLKLSPYRLHVPQVYGQLNEEIWLLEYSPIFVHKEGELPEEKPLPALTQVWQKATTLRQLNWLWQIAKLWQPLQIQKVASTLLNPSLLRVNGGIIKLLELQPDGEKQPNLEELGQLWQSWSNQSSSGITEFWQEMSRDLAEGKTSNSEQAIDILDREIDKCGHTQFEHSYQVFTFTHPGPTRRNNEDACYPKSGDLVDKRTENASLAIVCDGIGGHEGGEVASQLAIDFLQSEVGKISFDAEESEPANIALELEKLICAANDLISERNDRENRYEARQRMGTTLVMALARREKIYLTHVGDSRIYAIDPGSCEQVTVDDDLASREVRLGYALYRDAAQYPTAGALVQALGMSSSVTLHPTVQQLIVDEDCIFLLCSDGLSDFDRVEQYWQSEILPTLQGKKNIAELAKNLIDIANKKNGHDNVTVAIVYCKVKPKRVKKEIVSLDYSNKSERLEASEPQPIEEVKLADRIQETHAQQENQPVVSQKLPVRSGKLLLLSSAVILVGLGGLSSLIFAKLNQNLIRVTEEAPTTLNLPPVLAVGEEIAIQEEIVLQSFPEGERQNRNSIEKIPGGSILKVLQNDSNSSWLLLQVCQASKITESNSNSATLTSFVKIQQGWIDKKSLSNKFLPIADSEISKCNTEVNSDNREEVSNVTSDR